MSENVSKFPIGKAPKPKKEEGKPMDAKTAKAMLDLQQKLKLAGAPAFETNLPPDLMRCDTPHPVFEEFAEPDVPAPKSKPSLDTSSSDDDDDGGDDDKGKDERGKKEITSTPTADTPSSSASTSSSDTAKTKKPTAPPLPGSMSHPKPKPPVPAAGMVPPSKKSSTGT